MVETEQQVEIARTERTAIVQHAKKHSRYGSCGHKLAADNPGPMCSLCTRKALRTDRTMLLEDIERLYHKQGRDTEIADVGRLKALMRERDITVSWLARYTRIGEGYLYGWVRTGKAPLIGAKLIADTMGLTLDDLRAE